MANNDSEKDKDNKNALISDAEARGKIGRRVVYFALGAITVLGVTGIISVAFGKDATNGVKDILSMTLPVLGTWVGTVLAFYFSKDNFDSAAKQTSDLVRQLTLDQKLQEIPVKDVMISMTSSDTLKFLVDKSEDAINLKSEILENQFIKTGKNRLPFVDIEGKVKYIVHRSMIDKFISEKILFSDAAKASGLTLKDFLDADQYRQVAANFGTISPEAKLNAVKTLIDGNPDCSDVFVTEDGTKNGKTIGWITNVILAEKCRV